MRKFECYFCKNVFETDLEVCLHYEEDEKDDEGEVSLCDSCSEKVQETAKENNIENELSRKFFNCG